MDGMILHTGGYLVDRAQLRLVPTPNPTPSHVPVPHDLLLDEVNQALFALGIRIGRESLALAKNGQRFFGVLQLVHDDMPEGYAPVLGLRNSHDKTFAAQFVTGSTVFVCDNLAFSGSFLLTRKHTSRILQALKELVIRGVSLAQAALVEQDRRLEQYRLTRITDAGAHDLMVEMFRRQVFGPARIGTVIEQWHQPIHDEHAEDGRTLWRLMNAVTQALKGDGAPVANARLPQQTIKMHALLDEAAGLLPLKAAA